MQIKEFVSDRVKEKYFRFKHESGLDIIVHPKEGYSSTYAIFGTKYGSINRSFSLDGGETITVPDGIAHYLEHKLFESEDGDAFLRFAKTGANANAFTSFDKTCYLFSCSDNFEESLEILLDFVRSPYFTAQTVQKEQGIIGQEIKMYDDSPDWRVMFNMLECMYFNHPLKIDIAGTVESISHITADLLYKCYNTFYNLNNMQLVVVGNTDVDTVKKIADKTLKADENHTITNYFEEEPEQIVKPYVEQKMAVAVPMFNLGYKEKVKKRSAKELAAVEILQSILASSTSPLYEKLMSNNLINSSFSYEFSEGESFANIIFSGESRNPEKAAGIIKEYISKIHKDGFAREDFEIAKKACFGDEVSALNSVSNIATTIIDFTFGTVEYFDYIEACASITYKETCEYLKDILDNSKSVLSVILPN